MTDEEMEVTNVTISCSNCPYWTEGDGSDRKDMGFCQRYPVPHRSHKDYHCGEHPMFKYKLPSYVTDTLAKN